MGFLEENGIKAVAFDIDGTFYPLWKTNIRVFIASLPHLIFAMKYNKARQKLREEDSFSSLPVLSREENGKRMVLNMYGRCDEKLLNAFLKKEERVFTRRYESLFKSIKASNGVSEVLSLLKDKKYSMGVLSDFPIGSKLQAMKIESFFPVQISTEEIGRLKPSLTPFEILGEKLGVEKTAILYVGDSIHKDVEGAHRAGMKSALISTKHSDSSADLTVKDWVELRKKLF